MNKSKIMHRGIFYVSAIIGCLLLAGTLATAMNSPGSCYKCHSEGPMANISSRDATLSITCWEGYAQPYVKDFQALIENKYNLNLEIKIHNPTDQKEFYQAAKEGTADLISPPIELPKIPRFYCYDFKDRYLQPVVIKHIPNFKKMLPVFKDNTTPTFNGQRFGVPYNCGPYGLAYNDDKVKKEPQSWEALWENKYKKKYTINNNFPKCNVWITALALGYPQEKIFDIDNLDRDKIQKKLNILAKNAKTLWDGAANPEEFSNLSLATTWGFAVAKANQAGGNWKMTSPKEGGTAWIDAWYITQAAQGIKKRLAEDWINFMLEEKQQADVVKSQGVSPVLAEVGSGLSSKQKEVFNVGNNEYFEQLAIWRVMNEKTEKAFEEMWEEAKTHR
mgnify:CR=1 FL=1